METMKLIGIITRIGLGLTILTVLFYTIGIKAVVSHLAKADITLVAVAAVFFWLGILIGAGNFMMLAWPVNRSIRYFEFVRIFSLSWAISLFLPSRIGELSLIYYLKKDGIEMGKAAALFLIDKMITTAIIVTLAVFGFFLFFPETNAAFTVLLILLGAGILGLLVFLEPVRMFTRRHVLRSYAGRFDKFLDTFIYYVKNHKARLSLNFCISVVKWFVLTWFMWFLFKSIGVSLDLFTLMEIQAMLVIVALVPITLNGLGVRESAGVFLYSQVGVNAEAAAAFFLLLLILNYIIASLIFLFFWGRVKEHVKAAGEEPQ